MTSDSPKTAKRAVTPDLSELIAADKANRARETRILEEKRTREKRKKVIAIASASTAAVLLFGSLVIYDPFTQSLRWGNGELGQIGVGQQPGGDATSAPIITNWWQEPENQFPVDVPEWSKTIYNPENAETSQKAYESFFGTNVGMVGTGLPAESTGFTSDLSKQFLEDGSKNPDFSYWTDKVFTTEVGLMIERLTNPVFGGWVDSQFLTEAVPTSLNDLFTQRALEEMRNTQTRYPILLDTLDEDLVEGGTRWVGQMEKFEVTLSFNAMTGQYQGLAKVDILYTSWTKDKKKVTRSAVLTLNLVSNAGNSGNDSDNRILIDGSVLAVN